MVRSENDNQMDACEGSMHICCRGDLREKGAGGVIFMIVFIRVTMSKRRLKILGSEDE